MRVPAIVHQVARMCPFYGKSGNPSPALMWPGGPWNISRQLLLSGMSLETPASGPDTTAATARLRQIHSQGGTAPNYDGGDIQKPLISPMPRAYRNRNP